MTSVENEPVCTCWRPYRTPQVTGRGGVTTEGECPVHGSEDAEGAA